MKPYKHQERFLKENPDKALLAWEGNTGKTLAGSEWLKLSNRDENPLIVVPKRIKNKWKEATKGLNARILTKEEFKKTDVGHPSAFVFDEAHFAASPLFTRGRSQLTTRTYELIKANPNMPVLLLTATPISSTPWNLHTLLCFRGVYIDWKKWRAEFFDLVRLPYLPRPAYMPKPDWRIKIRPYLIKYASIVLMSDVMELPPITEEKVNLRQYDFDQTQWESSAAFVARHRHEQTHKAQTILELSEEYRKVIVVAHFREQIFELEKQLSRSRQIYVLHGGIDDQEAIIKQANEDDECFFIVQASIGVGFDAPSFNVMIFASMSYSYTNFRQMKWRVTRGNKIQPKQYYYLLAGKCDRAILKQVEKGKTFDPKYFNYYEAA